MLVQPNVRFLYSMGMGKVLGIIVGVIAFVILLFFFTCCVCPCCLLYKRRTTGTSNSGTAAPDPSGMNVTVVSQPPYMVSEPPPAGFMVHPQPGYPISPAYPIPAGSQGYPPQPQGYSVNY